MHIWKEIHLGEEGTRYVQDSLQQGEGLCARLLNLPLYDGVVFSPLPEGVSVTRAQDFDTGGLCSRSLTKVWLAEHIVNLCRTASNGLYIFQDIWARPDNPFASLKRGARLTTSKEVYFSSRCSSIDDAGVVEAFDAISSFLFVGAFSDIPSDFRWPSEVGVVGEDFIDIIANNTREIYISAYDQEGLVIWRR